MEKIMSSRKNFRILLVYPNLPLMLVPPLAVAIFTRIIKDEGFDVSLFDTTEYIDHDDGSSPRNRVKYLQARDFDEELDLGVTVKTGLLKEYKKKVLSYSPSLIIYTAVVEDVFIKCINMMKEIDKYKIPSIMGGVFPTFAPEKCLSHDCVNYVGIGEGEVIVRNFINAIYNGSDVHQIEGLAYKDLTGKVVKTPSPNLVNIESVIPDFSLFAVERFYRPMGGKIFKSIPVETYRGCPYQCTYCNSPTQRDQARSELKLKPSLETESFSNNFLRRKTMNHVNKEIKEIISLFDPEFLYFIDDSFMARPKKEMIDFCDMYSNVGLPFWFNTRPENCTSEMLKMLKDVGCYRISFGIECGNEEFRVKTLRRKGSNSDIKRWFRIISESNIPFSVNLIIGFPGETHENVMETVELVREITGFDTITVSIFTPYHGTHLRDISVQNKWLDDKTITVHTTSSSLLDMPPPFLSKSEIDSLIKVIPLYVFFSKKEWRNIRKIETNETGSDKLYDYYSLIYKRDFLGENVDDNLINANTTTGCSSDPKNAIQLA